MIEGGQIDYASYSRKMREALSDPDIRTAQGTINHSYFNTKKGFYWSEKHTEALRQGVAKYGIDLPTIRSEMFKGSKSLIELDMRVCMMFGEKELKNIKQSEVEALKKENAKGNKKR